MIIKLPKISRRMRQRRKQRLRELTKIRRKKRRGGKEHFPRSLPPHYRSVPLPQIYLLERDF